MYICVLAFGQREDATVRINQKVVKKVLAQKKRFVYIQIRDPGRVRVKAVLLSSSQ